MFKKKQGRPAPFPLSFTPVSLDEYTSISLHIPKYPWKWLHNILSQGSAYAWSSYMFDRHLKMPQVLNVSDIQFHLHFYFFLFPIPVSDRLIFCCGNSIPSSKEEMKMIKTRFFNEEKKRKSRESTCKYIVLFFTVHSHHRPEM